MISRALTSVILFVRMGGNLSLERLDPRSGGGSLNFLVASLDIDFPEQGRASPVASEIVDEYADDVLGHDRSRDVRRDDDLLHVPQRTGRRQRFLTKHIEHGAADHLARHSVGKRVFVDAGTTADID